MADIKIPAVGESITTAVIAAWHKNDGDTVAIGDPLLTLETTRSPRTSAPKPPAS